MIHVPPSGTSGNDERFNGPQADLLLQAALEEAKAYIKGFPWCHSINEGLYGLGVGGVVAVFLFEITADAGVDDRLWVVCGDLPSAYLVADSAPTPCQALERYCELIDAWIIAVRRKEGLSEVFPVAAEPTEENAKALERRVAMLREDVIPAFQ